MVGGVLQYSGTVHTLGVYCSSKSVKSSGCIHLFQAVFWDAFTANHIENQIYYATLLIACSAIFNRDA